MTVAPAPSWLAAQSKRTPLHVLVLVGALLGTSWVLALITSPWEEENTVAKEILVPKSDIEPYVLITLDMLEKKDASQVANSDASVLLDLGNIINRYGITRLKEGTGILSEQLGPVMAPGALSTKRITTVSVSDGEFVRGLTKGKDVTLVLSTTDVTKEPLMVPAATLLDLRTAGEKTWVVVGIPSELAMKFGQYVGGATVTLMR